MRVSLSEKDFNNLIKGNTITVHNKRSDNTVEIALKDIGFDVMKNLIIQAEVDCIFNKKYN